MINKSNWYIDYIIFWKYLEKKNCIDSAALNSDNATVFTVLVNFGFNKQDVIIIYFFEKDKFGK